MYIQKVPGGARVQKVNIDQNSESQGRNVEKPRCVHLGASFLQPHEIREYVRK